MFSFHWPLFILLLPLPWFLKFFFGQENVKKNNNPTVYFPRIEKLKLIMDSAHNNINHSKALNILWILFWIFLILTLMRPELVKQPEIISQYGHDIMLGVDLSRSMRALDFSSNNEKITRFKAVKEVVKKFIKQRIGDRVGLIVFAESAYSYVPLTFDVDSVNKQLKQLTLGMAGNSTSLGDAIGLAVKSLQHKKGERVLILLTDGFDNSSKIPPLQAAQLAAKHKIKIYTIGVGSKNNVVPIRDENGSLTVINSPLDEQLLIEIAKLTGGVYSRATSKVKLEKIYEHINKLEQHEGKGKVVVIRNTLHYYPLTCAIIALLCLFVLYVRHIIIKRKANKDLTNFADQKLLPHLLQNQSTKHKMIFHLLIIWFLLLLFAIIAMINPRWKFTEYETYKPGNSLVVLLDLSQSMQAEDIKPSRIIRAKQQIEDIIKNGKGINMGLIGFAKIAHLITPITNDFKTIKHLLHAIDTDLINKQGDDIKPALVMANELLQGLPSSNKNILIISDGDFDDNFNGAIQELKKNNVTINVAAVGTKEGAPFKDSTDSWKKENGKIVITKLQENRLKSMANGKYWKASYSEHDTNNFVNSILKHTRSNEKETTIIKQWKDEFYWFLFPMIFLALLLKREHLKLGLYVIFIGCMFSSKNAFAVDLFNNNAQQGKKLFDDENYAKAAEKFSDPYHKGVALYKAGKFEEAEKEFKKSFRKEVKQNAKYNLGNAQLKQGKYKAAIGSYNDVLKEEPGNKKAKDNLEIAEKLLKEEEKKQQEQNKNCNCKNKKASDQNSQSNEADDNKDNNKEQDKKSPEDKNDENTKDNERDEKEQFEDKKDSGSNENDNQQNEEMALSYDDQNQQNIDQETEMWLKRLDSDIKGFLKKKFYMEER